MADVRRIDEHMEILAARSNRIANLLEEESAIAVGETTARSSACRSTGGRRANLVTPPTCPPMPRSASPLTWANGGGGRGIRTHGDAERLTGFQDRTAQRSQLLKQQGGALRCHSIATALFQHRSGGALVTDRLEPSTGSVC